MESVAIVGAGAMGGMYAAHLARGGLGVRLVARGERARRLRETGLTVNGEPVPHEVVDADDAAEEPPADLILVAVKHQQLAEALDTVAPLAGPDTTFFSLLNGLDSERVIAERFDAAERVLPSIALAMDADRDGHDIRYRQAGRLVFGDPVEVSAGRDGMPSARVRALQRAFDRSGISWDTPADMQHQMWWKFMVNVGVNQASAVLREPYGAFHDDGPARAFMWALIDEVIAVGQAEGIDLGDADREKWAMVLAGQPALGRTSMHQDVVAGRPTEVDIFAGHVVELGRRHGIETPYNQTVWWILTSTLEKHAATDSGEAARG